MTELLTRGAKHLWTNYTQGMDMSNSAAAMSHFLNCFLSSCQVAGSSVGPDDLPNRQKKKGRRRNRPNIFVGNENTEWTLLSTKSLWSSLKSELQSYYYWDLDADSIDSAVELYLVQKISILRSFAMKTGIQLLLREFSMDAKNKTCFSEEDMMNIFPVVKHIQPRASDAYNFYTTGQSKIQQGFLKEGYELISEALNLLNNVYGAMHPEIAQCLRMLARLNYIMGDHQEAMSYQQKAVLMSEKVNGIDHPYTITEYVRIHGDI